MSSFEISSGTDRLEVAAGESREISFTITCVGDQLPLAKLWIECESAAAAQFIRIIDSDGEPTETYYHQFSAGDAHTLRVKVAPPENEAALETSLKLVIADDAQIQTTKKLGPPIQLTVKAKEIAPPPPKCNWKHWAIAAGVAVLILGTGVGLYLSSRVEFPPVAKGTRLDQAIDLLGKKGLKLHIEWEPGDGQLDSATITRAPYEKGEMVSTWFTVELGSTVPKVPNLVGTTWTEAHPARLPLFEFEVSYRGARVHSVHNRVARMEPEPGMQ